VWISRAVTALSLSAILASGCATGHGRSLAARFVRSGTPSVDLGGPPPPPKPSKGRSKPTDPDHRIRPTSVGASIENSDTRLSAALIVERALPTPENHLRVAREYRRLGILDACADHLQAAIHGAPQFAEAHEELARVWRDWGLPAYGLGFAYRAVYFAPRSASAYNTLGTILAVLGRFEPARKAYSQALSIDPNATWALNNLCDLERRFGHVEEGRSHCEAALRLDPSFAAAHNNLALILASTGDFEGARAQFLAGGDEAAADYNLGLLHLASGHYSVAASLFEKAIQIRPEFTAAKNRAHIARLHLMTGGN
jgi:Flp pilus assembly protein TadD